VDGKGDDEDIRTVSDPTCKTLSVASAVAFSRLLWHTSASAVPEWRLIPSNTVLWQLVLKKEGLMLNAEEMWQCQMINCVDIYDSSRGDKKGKIPRAAGSKICRTTGNARVTASASPCSSL